MNPKALLVAAALALAGLAAPPAAAAATRHHGHAHEAGPSYPMTAEEFRALMEKRIDRVAAAIDKKLERRGVSPDRKKAIHRVFDDCAKDVRAEIARATAGGKLVTQAQGDKVKALAIGLRARVRERLRAEKNPAAKAKLDKDHAVKHDKAVKHAVTDPDKSGAKSGMTKPTKAKADKKKADAKPAKAHAHKPAAKKHAAPKPETAGADL